MAEPASSGIAAYSAGKLALAGGSAAGVAALIVMLYTLPRSQLEWARALVSTFAFSLFGGAFTIEHFQLLDKASGMLGLVAIGGVFLACGLPGWAITRAWFNWTKNRENKDLGELLADAKKDFKP